MENMCPVCGFSGLFDPAYDPRGVGSDEICPCCGFQFGLDDYPDKADAVTSWRERWVAEECPWYSRSRKPPEDWNPQIQMFDAAFDDIDEDEAGAGGRL